VCLRLLPDSVTTVTRQRHGCNLNPGPSALESSTLTTLLPSHAYSCWVREFIMLYVYQLACKCTPRFTTVIHWAVMETSSSISSLRRLWTISHDVSPRRDDHWLKLTGYEAYATTWGETSTSAAAITRTTVTGSAIMATMIVSHCILVTSKATHSATHFAAPNLCLVSIKRRSSLSALLVAGRPCCNCG